MSASAIERAASPVLSDKSASFKEPARKSTANQDKSEKIGRKSQLSASEPPAFDVQRVRTMSADGKDSIGKDKLEKKSSRTRNRSTSKKREGKSAPKTFEDKKLLRKAIIDLSKTKKKKEYDHEMKLRAKFTQLLASSAMSNRYTNQNRKVGKRIISEVETQI